MKVKMTVNYGSNPSAFLRFSIHIDARPGKQGIKINER